MYKYKCQKNYFEKGSTWYTLFCTRVLLTGYLGDNFVLLAVFLKKFKPLLLKVLHMLLFFLMVAQNSWCGWGTRFI